jgi:hypothetical protein
MTKRWITAIAALLSMLVVAVAPAMAHTFTAGKTGKTAGRGYEEIEIPAKPAQPEFIPERMQEFRLGKFRILCYTERSKGEIAQGATEIFETTNRYSRCGWYPQSNALHVGAGFSNKTGLKVSYYTNGWADIEGNGEGEVLEYKGLGARETAALIKISSSKACTIAIPEQTIPIKAVNHPEEEFTAVLYSNEEVENERLRLFPTGFQKKVVFDNEMKTLHFKYIGEESQCTNLEEFEKQSEEEGGGTGVYKGKIIQEVAGGDLSYE